jgi:Xaa-Pro aminopeptidase
VAGGARLRHNDDVTSHERFQQRRRRVLAALAEHPQAGGAPAAVVFSTPTAVRNADVEHPYRQDSDLYWLTGFAEPSAALVLLPGRAEGEAVLFLRPKDRDLEKWEGRRLGVEAAPAALGVDAALPIDRLDVELARLLVGRTSVFAHFGRRADDDARVLKASQGARARCRRKGRWPTAWIDLSTVLAPLRARKDEHELDALRRAADVTCRAHARAMAECRPGVRESDLEAALQHEFTKGGAARAGYGSIVAAGANATILHYVENTDVVAAGQLVLIDAGAEVDFYTADVTRTFPASGTFTPAQRDVYEIVLAANEAAIAAVKPGASMRAIDELARRVLAEGLVSLGVLKGSVDGLIEKRPFDGMPDGHAGKAPLDAYYPHSTGHWLGMDVHDVGPYHDGADPIPLAPRMVLTVEPGLYFDVDDATVDERFRGIGVRIEDDVVVEETGARVLTSAAPKSIAALEQLVGSA